MITFFLIFVVVGWWLVETLLRHGEHVREENRRKEVLALRQRYVGMRPNDPAAQTMLGDALRQAGHPEAALQAYTEAEKLYAGAAAGADLAQKKRLTALDIDVRKSPEKFGQTLQTRESVCRRCGALNLPNLQECAHCGAALLVEGFWETAAPGGKMRGDLLKEVLPIVGKTVLVMIATVCATFLPWEIRGAVLIATILVVPFAWLRNVGNPSLGD